MTGIKLCAAFRLEFGDALIIQLGALPGIVFLLRIELGALLLGIAVDAGPPDTAVRGTTTLGEAEFGAWTGTTGMELGMKLGTLLLMELRDSLGAE